MRSLAVVVHRYVGLVMAGFLLIAGLTGCILVWYHELDAALNPHLMQVTPPVAVAGEAESKVLDPLVLRERVQAAYPGSQVHHVSFHQARPEDARAFYIEAPLHAFADNPALSVDEVFINPYTGDILGGRRWGDIGQGLTNLLPFIYRLHYSLALGTVGTWAFGIVALLWTLDCFVGAWLTFPNSRKQTSPAKSWWARWAPAWQIRWRSGAYKINFDVHRAFGLWPWALLLVLAWSSVAFNLHGAVYRPVMGVLFELQPDPRASLPDLVAPQPNPPMGWPAAWATAREHMAAVAHEQGLVVMAEDRMSYDPDKGYLRYVVRTDRDINERRGQTALFVDATTGRRIATVLPTGQASGDTLTSWATTLHMAHIWGLPFRVFMTFMGLVVAALSVTGVIIWWRKRTAQRSRPKASPRPR